MMEKFILFCLITGAVFVSIPPSVASYKAVEPSLEVQKPSISSLITQYAERYQVSQDTMRRIIYCESQYRNIQSLIPSESGPNGREDSWGIVQIHLPDHPSVSRAEALDREFSVKFLAQKLSTGNGRIWTCFRLLGYT